MKVIYIEDDPASTVVMQQMLAPAGITVQGAPDAREGLAMIDRDGFDLILMDLRLPVMNGLTAIRQLRARETAGRRLPIIVVSAELTAGVRELCRTAGADACVEKPVSMDQLFQAVGATIAASETCVVR